MAIDVKFSICQKSKCKEISFTEKTGAYSLTNTTGWGTPNEETTDATAATLSITGPDGTVYDPINLFTTGNYPKSSDTSVSILSTTLNSSMTSFADGFWTMIYAVTTGTETYTRKITFFFTCKIESCICKMLANLNLCDCNCDNEEMNKVLSAKAYADALQYAVGCGNTTGANEILKTLTRICECC